ncbi:MAG TPA: hypothetical protein VEV17_09000 [Bryobacteraceae bacterium]|nr:hypothetical protein [Bryobacteraceae bacterium]
MVAQKRVAAWIALVAISATGSILADSNSWTNVGPEGGPVVVMAFDPYNPDTVYGATGTGVFKSTDGGASWRNAGLMGNGVNSLLIHPQDSSILYALASGHLFKSTDSAATWNQADSALGVVCMAVDPQDPGTVYIATPDPGGVLKTTNGGTSWQSAGAGLPPGITSLAIDPQTPSTLYAAGFRMGPTIFKSTDGGASWLETDARLPKDRIFLPGVLTIDAKNTATVYFTSAYNGVFKSKDGGATWTDANSGLVGKPCCRVPTMIVPQNSNMLFTVNLASELFKSVDGGASWKIVGPSPPPFWPLIGLAVHPQDSSTLYAATGTGAFKSADGGITWSAAYSGMRAIAVDSLAIDPQTSGNIYYGTGFSGVYKTTDYGMTFSASTGINSGFPVVALAMDPQTPSNLYAGTGGGDCGEDARGGLFRSVDGSVTWTDTGLVTCVAALVTDPQTPSTVYGATWDRGVVKSTDGGAAWASVNVGLHGGPINALALDAQTPGTIYAAASGTSGGLYKSTDGGNTWNATGLNGTVVGTQFISGLAIDPENTSTVYAATADSNGSSGGLWKSTDGGANWQNLFSSSSSRALAVIVSPQNSGTLYAGTDAGVMTSADGGQSWMPVPGSPTFTSVLALDPQNPNTLYAGGAAGLFAITFGS